MYYNVRSLLFSVFVCLFFGCVARGILVPRPGIEPGHLAVKAQSPNHWTAREFPVFLIVDLKGKLICFLNLFL